MRADLMSFSIFLFLTGTENIFVWFGRVDFCFPSLLSFPTSHSPPLLSKHSKPRTAAEPCPPRRSPSCSTSPGFIIQELWSGSRDTKIHPLGWAEAGCTQHQEAPPPCKSLCVGLLTLCLNRGASLKQLWLKKGEVPTMMLLPGEGCLANYLCSSHRLALQASKLVWLIPTLLETFFSLKPDGIIHFFFWERFLAHGALQTMPSYLLWMLAAQGWQWASLHQ